MEHPAVAEAGVIGKPDPMAGEIVKAFVSLKPDYASERRAASRFAGLCPQAVRRGGRAQGDRLRRQRAEDAQRQNHAPAAQGARTRAAGRRHLHAGERLMASPADSSQSLAGARSCAGPSARDAAHPPLRRKVRGALQRRQDPRLSPSLYRRGSGRRRRDASAGSPTTRSWRRIASTATRWFVASRPTSIMAEMYGKQEGCSRGRGGSMHLFDAATHFYGGNAIVGGGLPIAVGLALADKMQGRTRVTACFFGEGAVAEGEFHECMNLAALWKLPVLFCCENNLYAMGTALKRSESEIDLCLKASSYEMPAWPVDGMDVVACEEAARRAVTRRAFRRRTVLSSSFAPIVSALTRCSTRSCIAKSRKSRSGRSAIRSRRSRRRLREQGLLNDEDLKQHRRRRRRGDR